MVGSRKDTTAELSVGLFASLQSGTTVVEVQRAARGQAAKTTLDSEMVSTAFGYPDFRLIAPTRALALSRGKPRASWDKPLERKR